MGFRTWDERAAERIEDEYESGEMSTEERREAMRALRYEVQEDVDAASRERALEYGLSDW